MSFRPKALDFLPGAGQAPEEAPRPAPPPPTPPPPAIPPLIESPPALYAGTPPSLANPSQAREPIDPRPMLGVVRWIILAGAAGRILLAHM